MGRQYDARAKHQINANSADGEGGPSIPGHHAMAANYADRIVFLSGAMVEGSMAGVVAQLLHLSSVSNDPIRLVVSTYGGSVDEMFSLYDTIKFLRCPVRTVALGKVMSAGVLITAAGEKGHRLVGATSRIMVHSIAGAAAGNVFEIESNAQEHRRLQALMVRMLARETKMKVRAIEAIMNSKIDRHLTPDEAVQLGIVDRIIGSSD